MRKHSFFAYGVPQNLRTSCFGFRIKRRSVAEEAAECCRRSSGKRKPPRRIPGRENFYLAKLDVFYLIFNYTIFLGRLSRLFIDLKTRIFKSKDLSKRKLYSSSVIRPSLALTAPAI